MRVVIMGCGRVGARLAGLMEQEGYTVSIIDSDPLAFSRLPDSFNGSTVLGTGIDVDVLKSAGIEGADAFAAVTNFDNTNIMACEVAKEIFGVDRVLARIYDPGRESFYHQLGLETVCPTTLVSTTAHDILCFEGTDEELHQATGYVGGSEGLGMNLNIPKTMTASASGSQPKQPALEAEPEPVRENDEHNAAHSDTEGKAKHGIRGLFRSS